MNLNEWTLNQAAGLLNEEFEPLGSNEQYSAEELRKIAKQREMLHEETDSDSNQSDPAGSFHRRFRLFFHPSQYRKGYYRLWSGRL